ncbi:apolipoprotein N-acyltransferase [Sulfurimonas sp.]|uniref:apolipoprotein N-acyltransferase n=1 Tax=Sulfurimonas sp. TaxID=2022749 RepID=UPI0025E46EF2|nr:apolipoprotein N-acyltransferase [Sulfurimonas sp.]
MIKKIESLRDKQELIFDIFTGLLTALIFSAFIYFEHWGITLKLVNTIFGVIALALLLYIPKRAVLVAGFTIGLLWFYWIGYSFKYNGVGYLTPVITFSFAIIYMLFFGVLALTNKVYIRALLLFGLSFFEPFDWNWLQIELLFVDSYIGVLKYQLFIVLLALSLPNYLKGSYKKASIFILILAINFNPTVTKLAPLKIKLITTEITQDKKWTRDAFKPTILMIFKEIRKAIDEEYEIIVFPESVFPLFMNENLKIINRLEEYSNDISIIAGSLYRDEGNNYNVTYMFEDGKYEMAKKLVLVPFGEYIPLPKFAQKIINDMFFAGQADFVTAEKPTDFIIKGVKFRNAICYEATCAEIYEGDVSFVIATSNNAWFAPSIEPTIQKLLMRYYARKNATTIYHSTNYKGTGIIK